MDKVAQEDNIDLSFPISLSPWPSGREGGGEPCHTLIVPSEFATCRHTHVELVSRVTIESWMPGNGAR